jgi:hypothetical protein
MVYTAHEELLSTVTIFLAKSTGRHHDGQLCSMPVTYSHRQCKSHGNKSYAVSRKADGERRLLVIDDDNRVYLLNPRNKEVTLLSDASFSLAAHVCRLRWKFAIFDAEYVVENKEQHLWVFDCMGLDTENFTNDPFETRFRRMNIEMSIFMRALAFSTPAGCASTMRLHIKPFYDTWDDVKRYILIPNGLFSHKETIFAQDGVIIVNKQLPGRLGTDPACMKLKAANTCDLEVTQLYSSGNVNLSSCSWNRSSRQPRMVSEGSAYIQPNTRLFDEINRLYKGKETSKERTSSCVIEAECVNQHKRKWKVHQVRHDKSKHAISGCNSDKVVQSCLVADASALSMRQELYNLFHEHEHEPQHGHDYRHNHKSKHRYEHEQVAASRNQRKHARRDSR